MEQCYARYIAIFPFAHEYTLTEWSVLGPVLCRLRTDAWRVIGISRNALNLFAENDFKRLGKQINRSHIVNRSDTWGKLRERLHTMDEFWSVYYENDTTVLATSSENNGSIHSEVYPIDPKLDLFHSTTIRYKHNNKEREFLRQLYAKVNE